jgi:hypothetical protein
MKKLLILSILLIVGLTLGALTVPRMYVQKLVLNNGQDPVVTADSGRSANEYILTAQIVEFPDSIMSTQTKPMHSIAVKQVGDGVRFPFTVVASVQLGNFGVDWKPGMTMHMVLTHRASGETKAWDIVIPEGTALIKHLDNPITIPPWSRQ